METSVREIFILAPKTLNLITLAAKGVPPNPGLFPASVVEKSCEIPTQYPCRASYTIPTCKHRLAPCVHIPIMYASRYSPQRFSRVSNPQQTQVASTLETSGLAQDLSSFHLH